ncbi:MAG TPA: hypothetical protein VKU19_35930 [Bryobacteraceae bacterium]|nr:hypothetical protein [Bryobacteraceae bacterium]
MRLAVILCLAASLANAQDAKPAAITKGVAAAPMQRPGISRQTFTDLEKSFDTQLGTTGGAHPIDILGLTRGVYLEDYGVVFTAEVSLTQTPTLNPFRKEITQELKNEVYRQKVENLPLLRKAMREMVKTTAMTMGAVGVKMNILKPNSQVVLAVRLLYLPYENTTGLPGQIIMKADLKSAMSDDIKVEEQF